MKNYVTTLGIAVTLALPPAAQAQGVTPPPVSTNIEVPAPNEAFLLGRGLGTQNYDCQPVNSLGRVGWLLFTPQATLFGDRGEQLTTHFFSPNPFENGIPVRATWQDSRDTSIVWGSVIESSVDPNFVKAGAIPWLKIDVANTGFQDGPTGGDTLSKTTLIQRVNTDGGAAPSTDCDRPSDHSLQTPRSNRSGTHARSKKRIIIGAIAGSVGGFFAGGFLGAHIEGDRCDCDDPGVRGFLIGAPIGAVAGGIFGAKFLF